MAGFILQKWGVALCAAALLMGCAGRGDRKRGDEDTGVSATRVTETSESADPPTRSAAPVESADPVTEAALVGLSLAELNPREKTSLAKAMNKLPSPCADTPVALSQCLTQKRSCKLCKPAAEFLGRMVAAGATDTDLDQVYNTRFDPTLIKTIEIGKAPFKGPKDAPVTVVEFADFQCPGCREVRHALELLLVRFPDQVRVVYKYYQISGHDRSLEAAYAAHAAHLQGKFWEMHELLFANKDALARSDFQKYAGGIGLDLQKFNAAFDSEATKKVVAADIAQADTLGLEYTPLLYVNGREMTLNPFTEELERWVQLEIEQAGQVPAEPSAKYQAMAKELRQPPPSPPRPPQ